MLFYHAAVFLYALGLCGTALVNFLCFRRPRPMIGSVDTLPRVSVLVPARNEEDGLEACLLSLLALEYPALEIVVLDDRSTDRTGAIIRDMARQDARLCAMTGTPLPEGWCGKPWACWQMAQQAMGDYLLLTDADCRFVPDAVLQALGAAQDARADVVSLVPRLDAQGFWERLVIPLQYFIIYAFLPTPLVRKTPFPSLAAANGAFLFLKRETYFALDGHRAVRGELAEDVAFVRHVKRQGRTLWYGDGARTYSVRMYDGLPAIWQGFSRSLFAAFGGNVYLLSVVVLAIVCAFVLPPFWAVGGLLTKAVWWPLPLATYVALALVRLGLTVRYRRDNFWYAPAQPAGVGDGVRDSGAVGAAIRYAARHRMEGPRVRT